VRKVAVLPVALVVLTAFSALVTSQASRAATQPAASRLTATRHPHARPFGRTGSRSFSARHIRPRFRHHHIPARHVIARRVAAHDVPARHISVRHISVRHVPIRRVEARHVPARHVPARRVGARRGAARHPGVLVHPHGDGVMPTWLRIPAIGVSAPVRPMGLLRGGYIQVPPLTPHSNIVGWYKYGPVPGDTGPAILLGHRDSDGIAVFYRLGQLARGDQVYVTRSDRSTAVFTVASVRYFHKSAFPDQLVYESDNTPALRLVTCGGVFDYRLGAYEENIVVYAAFTDVRNLPFSSRHIRLRAHPVHLLLRSASSLRPAHRHLPSAKHDGSRPVIRSPSLRSGRDHGAARRHANAYSRSRVSRSAPPRRHARLLSVTISASRVAALLGFLTAAGSVLTVATPSPASYANTGVSKSCNVSSEQRLSVELTGGKNSHVSPGDAVTYTGRIYNPGPATFQEVLTSIELSDHLTPKHYPAGTVITYRNGHYFLHYRSDAPFRPGQRRAVVVTATVGKKATSAGIQLEAWAVARTPKTSRCALTEPVVVFLERVPKGAPHTGDGSTAVRPGRHNRLAR
jgi:LPXTG-site transpeptidase (sortase) family protein